ncbi:PD-(D/E)XK motif protein [Streptomyces bauhiniae]|uniref:PD-(D/E)XK motif protein n=1 Tax=Streptomyces bauhiniae TaxID=2340725 RepID=UPI003318EC1D
MLAATGYRAVDAERYRTARFEVREERWYRVTSGFPRLTTQVLLAAGVPADVRDVEYTIDLSTGTPQSIEADEVACLLDQLVQESV